MLDFPKLDALDRQLIGALQIYPRVSWSQLAPILATPPTTLARRWNAIIARGVAWSTVTTALPGTAAIRQLAFVQARCAGKLREETIAALSTLEEVGSIDTVSGEYDLMLTVATKSIHDVDRLVNDHIIVMPGITRTRTHYVNGIKVDGSNFRIPSLTPAQQASVTALKPLRLEPATLGPTETQDRVIAQLTYDGRRPASEISRRTGLPTSTVNRLINQLMQQPWLYPRTDISMVDFGLIAVYICVRCPVDLVNDVVAFLRYAPGLRTLVTVISRANILFSIWVPDFDQITQFESRLSHAFPAAEITDRWLQTSHRKRIGILLDNDGRATHLSTPA